MRKLTSLFLAFLLLVSPAGCSTILQNGETTPPGTSHDGEEIMPVGDTTDIETHFGTVLEHFTEGAGEDIAECLRVQLFSGEAVVFTITEHTVKDDFLLVPGINVYLTSQSQPGSGYRPILSLTTANPVTVDAGDYYAGINLPPHWEICPLSLPDGPELDARGVGMRPIEQPGFQANLVYYPDRFGICGTGMTITEFTLPCGITAYQYTEQIDNTLFFHIFLSPEVELQGSLLVQGQVAPQLWSLYESQLHEVLSTLVFAKEDQAVDF